MVIEAAYVVWVKDFIQDFIVVKQNSKLKADFDHPGVFHAVGCWVESLSDKEKMVDKLDDAKIEEVWIPWKNIVYVESLIYRQRS
jgi:hypothetical protein